MDVSARCLRLALCGAASLLLIALAPQAASAAVVCHQDGNHDVWVTLTAANDRAQVERLQGGGIAVGGVACDGATVSNTNEIKVVDVSGAGTTVVLDAEDGSFAPGVPLDEGFGSEIEISVDLSGGDDTLTVFGELSGAQIVLGDAGMNTNRAFEHNAEDADVFFAGAEHVAIAGDAAADKLSGDGGFGTGAPYGEDLRLTGGGGNDELRGGDDPWGTWMSGGAGDDLLIATGTGGDYMLGGAGNDTIKGGPGDDEAQYWYAPTGVKVDLAVTTPQDTGGAGIDTITDVEGLSGSEHDDVLKGTAANESFLGQGGDDVLEGRGGPDSLYGGDGADVLRNGAGTGMLLGGDGEDTAAYDDAVGPVTLDLGLMGVQQSPTASGIQFLDGIEDVIGSPFADRLTGSKGANAIDGRGGADAIDGRAGSDRLGGGAGIDTVESRDGAPDFISCGAGPDKIAKDAIDALAPDCAPTAPGSGPRPVGGVPGPPAAPVLSLAVPRQSLRRVLARGLRVTLTCSTACRAGGRLFLARAAARRLGIARRVGRLAPVDLAAGDPRAVRVRLTPAARAALRRARVVRLALRVHGADAAGQAAAPVSRAVRLRAR